MMNKARNTLGCAFGMAVAAAAVFAAVAGAQDDAEVFLLRADRVLVGDGRVIEGGAVLIRDGRIVAVGADIPLPEGARIIHVPGGTITPGLIDAHARIEPRDAVSGGAGRPRQPDDPFVQAPDGPSPLLLACGHGPNEHGFLMMCDGTPVCSLAAFHDDLGEDEDCPICGGEDPNHEGHLDFATGLASNASFTEGGSEVVPHTDVLDAVDLRSPDFERLVRGGVTTVFISGDSAAVIGPRGAVVRTGGPMSQRILSERDAVLAAISSDTYRIGGGNTRPGGWGVSVRARRPSSRMGVAWVFRKAFYDTERYVVGAPVGGADAPEGPAMEALAAIRRGEIPLRMQARTMRDIATAVRLAAEFGLPFTLVEPVEAYECLSVIQDMNIPVIYGPIYMDPSGPRAISDETRRPRLTTAAALLGSGVTTALTAQDLREEDGLVRQAMYAVRGGADPGAALAAVTGTPAKMLGLEDELGSVEAGKRADLVVWTADPLSPASRAALVLIDGRVVFDGRDEGPTAGR